MRFNDNLWALHAALAPEILKSLKDGNEHENAPQNPLYALQNGVAAIDIDGPIDREAWFFAAGQDEIRAALDAAMNDAAVKAILLSFNSPGGVVSGTKELADYIVQCAKIKPLAAYADGLCASAAYWLAAATGKIYAPITAQVGGIGVIAVHASWVKAAKEAGITRTVIYSGKWKAAGSPDKELTEAERAMFQAQLDALHAIFKADISRFMRPKGDDWAEGQTFLGEEAKKRGLITAIVADKAQAIGKLGAIAAKGEHMDLQELKAAQPELLEQFRAEIESGMDGELAEAARSARSEIMALVEAVAGEDVAAKVDAVMATGITAAQFKALSGIFPKAETPRDAPKEAPQKPDTEAAARAEMLAALQNAHGEAVNAAQVKPAACSLVADAERRAGGVK